MKRPSIRSKTYRDVVGWSVNGVFTPDRRKAEMIADAYAAAPQTTISDRLALADHIDDILLAEGGR